MSDKPTYEYHWRETFFLFFRSEQRPTLTQIEARLSGLRDSYELGRMLADEDGQFESLTIDSPEDNAAVEISYESGEAVIEQAVDLAKQLQGEADSEDLAKLLRADARFDLMHFERVSEGASDDYDDDFEDVLDPGCVLLVVDAMVNLTDGIAVDPAAGSILP